LRTEGDDDYFWPPHLHCFNYDTMYKTSSGLISLIRHAFNHYVYMAVIHAVNRNTAHLEMRVPSVFSHGYGSFELIMEASRIRELYTGWNCQQVFDRASTCVDLDNVIGSPVLDHILAELPSCLGKARAIADIHVPHGTPPIVMNVAIHARLSNCRCARCLRLLRVPRWAFGSEVQAMYPKRALKLLAESLLRVCLPQPPTVSVPSLTKLIVSPASDIMLQSVLDSLHARAQDYLMNTFFRSPDQSHFWPLLHAMVDGITWGESRGLEPNAMLYANGKVRFFWGDTGGKRRRSDRLQEKAKQRKTS
jgi:hypothetical protein